ncbi:hypothetical protein MKW98_013988 [Papaver atlanticum]|uniref:Bet v I/Major latex protein domain-containing protein n=1 Tax=Papaver atlanticum TaxID=357466 RepID=A0AAD4SIE7_9MAGN|nr:hypothetical protein MKW98_013988 [Papaver atlanticum]
MAYALGIEAEIKCSANMFYGLFKDNITELKNLFPEIYESIHVIEGHGPSVGSVRLWKYKLGMKWYFATTKDRMVTVNDEIKSITWSLEGDMKNFEIKLNTNGDVQFPTAFINYLHTLTVKLPSRLLKRA